MKLPTSSSSNITTTTLLEGWSKINIELLKSIGFSETQLLQLQDKNHPEIVQESIYHFAYGLEHNPKFKNYAEPLNVLMGVLRKGQAWFEKEYQSPQELAMKQLLEQKKVTLEREKTLADERVKLEFEEWLNTLTSEDKERLSVSFSIPSGLKHAREAVVRSKLLEHFKQYVCKR